MVYILFHTGLSPKMEQQRQNMERYLRVDSLRMPFFYLGRYFTFKVGAKLPTVGLIVAILLSVICFIAFGLAAPAGAYEK